MVDDFETGKKYISIISNYDITSKPRSREKSYRLNPARFIKQVSPFSVIAWQGATCRERVRILLRAMMATQVGNYGVLLMPGGFSETKVKSLLWKKIF